MGGFLDRYAFRELCFVDFENIAHHDTCIASSIRRAVTATTAMA